MPSLCRRRVEQTAISLSNETANASAQLLLLLSLPHRVMPHSEYPSGSGCICTAVMQYLDAFVQVSRYHSQVSSRSFVVRTLYSYCTIRCRGWRKTLHIIRSYQNQLRNYFQNDVYSIPSTPLIFCVRPHGDRGLYTGTWSGERSNAVAYYQRSEQSYSLDKTKLSCDAVGVSDLR